MKTESIGSSYDDGSDGKSNNKTQKRHRGNDGNITRSVLSSPTSNNHRKRTCASNGGGDIDTTTTAITTATTINELLREGSDHDGLSRVAAFLTHAERWKMAEACRGMRRMVETYCRGAFAEIVNNHRPDDDFVARLRKTLPTKITKEATEEGGGGEEEEATPATLPYRYLLEAAKNTYLYKFDAMHGDHPNVSGHFALGDAGEGRRLLVLAGTDYLKADIRELDPNECPPVFLYLWDLTNKNKRCVWHVEISSVELEECEVKKIFFMNDYRYIVACTSRRALVCSIASGELVRSYSNSRYIEAVAMRDDNTVIFFGYNTNRDTKSKLISFNVVTGEAQDLTEMEVPHPVEMGVLNNRWMVLESKVFDMENEYRQVDHIPQLHLFDACECPGCDGKQNTFCAAYYNKILMFRIDSDTGTVSLESSVDFDFDGGSYRGNLGDRVFVEKNKRSSAPTLQAVDISSGTVKRNMTLPPDTRQNLINYMVSSNGFELFVGVEPIPKEGPRGPKAIIAVYLAGEHY